MLEDFIKVNKLGAKIFEAPNVRTSVQAEQIVGPLETIAKSIVLVCSDGTFALVVLLGADKIDFSKVKKVLGVSDVRLASPKEVLEISGYEIGGVPPISIYGVRPIVDASVAEKEQVVCGGGDAQHLMRIKVGEILSTNEDAIVADIAIK